MTIVNSPYLTTKELAQLLRLGERKIYDLAANGEIPCVRAVGKLLFPRDEINAWLNDTRSGPLMRPVTDIPPIIAGSHDPLLDWALRNAGSGLAGSFDGSHDGLEKFANKQIAVCLLHIKEDGEWNLPICSLAHIHFTDFSLCSDVAGNRVQLSIGTMYLHFILLAHTL